jgi:predicted RNase H-like HicB family nuclease
MSINFTYWQEPDGMWLGYMNDYPDYMTEGYSFEDLKRMLLSLRADIEEMRRNGELTETTRHSGVLEYA